MIKREKNYRGLNLSRPVWLADSIGERDLVDESFDADEFVDIDFGISTSKTNILTNEEIVKTIRNDDKYTIAEEIESDKEIEVNDVSPQKPTFSEIEEAVELLKRWSLFDKDGDEIRRN